MTAVWESEHTFVIIYNYTTKLLLHHTSENNKAVIHSDAVESLLKDCGD